MEEKRMKIEENSLEIEEENSKAKKEELIRIIKFTLFSISAGLIQIIVFTILNEVAKLKYWPSYLIALTLSVVWNFTINRKITFKSANNVPLAMFLVFCFYAVFTPLSTWWGDVLTENKWNEYLVLIGTMIINFVTEFLFDRFIVFKNSLNTAK